MIDLDSHLMEPRGFLVPFAPTALRDVLVLTAAPDDGELARGAGGSWASSGSFDPWERTAWLDQQGIDRQLVLPGLSHVAFLGGPHAVEAARAQRRAVLDWTGSSDRFVPVAVVPIDDPDQALALVAEVTEAGIRFVLLTTARSRPRSPIEAGQDRVWRAIAERGLVAVLHYGTTGASMPGSWRQVAAGPGADAPDPIDVLVAHHGAEAVLARLALSGRFGGPEPLRVLVAEHGAGWLPSFLSTLDACQRAFRRIDPALPQDEPLSEQVRRCLTVVPFTFEPVGDLIDRVGDDVLAFGTDYPHPEGGRDPAGTFRARLAGRPAPPFLTGNGTRLIEATGLCAGGHATHVGMGTDPRVLASGC